MAHQCEKNEEIIPTKPLHISLRASKYLQEDGRNRDAREDPSDDIYLGPSTLGQVRACRTCSHGRYIGRLGFHGEDQPRRAVGVYSKVKQKPDWPV
jgi:hypothetical protein